MSRVTTEKGVSTAEDLTASVAWLTGFLPSLRRVAVLALLGPDGKRRSGVMWNNPGKTPPRNKGRQVPVKLEEARRLSAFARRAATPSAITCCNGPLARLDIRAPGATPANTEVRWDAGTERLSVGVWCGKPPKNWYGPFTIPLPELAWYRSFHLPRYDGANASVVVERGVIAISVPEIAERPAPPPGGTGAEVIDISAWLSRGARPVAQDRKRVAMAAGIRWATLAISLAACAVAALPFAPLALFLLLPLLPFICFGWLFAGRTDERAPTRFPTAPSALASGSWELPQAA